MERGKVADALQNLGSGVGSAAAEGLAQGVWAGILVETREAEVRHLDVVLVIQQQVLAF